MAIESIRAPRLESVNFARKIGTSTVHLVNSRDLLAPGIKNGFAVPFINTRIFPTLIGNEFRGPSSVRSIMIAMRELKAPMGIEIAQSEVKYCNVSPENLVRHVTEEAARLGIKYPIAIHFDHGETPELRDEFIRKGATSLAFDGGKSKDWDTLITNARAWVALAHPLGISVEGEMETIGGQIATEPEKAKEFVEATGVDVLVVAFLENEHGAVKGASKIDEAILRGVRANVLADVALNLHGGSGFSYDILARAVELGITKVNYATEVMRAMLKDTMFGEMLIQLAKVEAQAKDSSGEKAAKIKSTKDARQSLKALFATLEWANMGVDLQRQMEEQGAQEIIRVSRAIGNENTAGLYI